MVRVRHPFVNHKLFYRQLIWNDFQIICCAIFFFLSRLLFLLFVLLVLLSDFIVVDKILWVKNTNEKKWQNIHRMISFIHSFILFFLFFSFGYDFVAAGLCVSVLIICLILKWYARKSIIIRVNSVWWFVCGCKWIECMCRSG